MTWNKWVSVKTYLPFEVNLQQQNHKIKMRKNSQMEPKRSQNPLNKYVKKHFW